MIMNKLTEILSGIGILIGIYLLLSHAGAVTTVVSSIGGYFTNGVQKLQGRS